MPSSFIKSSRPWNIQVDQRSQSVLSMSEGQPILCYSKGLTAPFVVRKVAVRNAICRNRSAVGIVPPYLTLIQLVWKSPNCSAGTPERKSVVRSNWNKSSKVRKSKPPSKVARSNERLKAFIERKQDSRIPGKNVALLDRKIHQLTLRLKQVTLREQNLTPLKTEPSNQQWQVNQNDEVKCRTRTTSITLSTTIICQCFEFINRVIKKSTW